MYFYFSSSSKPRLGRLVDLALFVIIADVFSLTVLSQHMPHISYLALKGILENEGSHALYYS
jgi:hypothetical protein